MQVELSEDFDSDDDDDLTSKKKHDHVEQKQKLSSAPTMAEASPPTVKRSRSQIEGDGETDTEVKTYQRQKIGGVRRPAVPGGHLSDLHKRFGVGVAKKESALLPKSEYEIGIHDPHHGPYYL